MSHCGARNRKPVAEITDRAKRYRANTPECQPDGPRVCAYCGSQQRNLDVHHKDGNEDNGAKRNLAWACRSCNVRMGAEMSAKGQGKRTRQFNKPKSPTFAEYSAAVASHRRGSHDAGGAVIHQTPPAKRREYAGQIWDLRRQRGNPGAAAADLAYEAGREQGKLDSTRTHNVDTIKKAVVFAKKLAQSSSPSEITELKRAFLSGYAQTRTQPNPGRRRRRNSGALEAAAAASELFHGTPAREITVIESEQYEHVYLTACGDLVSLEVVSLDGKPLVIEGLGDAVLAMNPERTQLFIEGGDQAVDVRPFGIDPAALHENEVLGTIEAVTYSTIKYHLGDEGGDADYRHEFGDENGSLPLLLYDVRNERLAIAGGSYTIEPEGIGN